MASETVNSQRTAVLHPQMTNGVLYRNNSGACMDETGRLVRYGLGHISAQQVREWASSDYIGITPEYVFVQRLQQWRWLGVFTAAEIKPSDWRMPALPNVPKRQWPDATVRAFAQAKFHDIVRSMGGYAGFVTDPENDLRRILERA